MDENTRDAAEEDIFQLVSGMLDRQGNNPSLYSTTCGASAVFGTTVIANNHGTFVHEDSTSAAASFEAVIREGDEQVSGWWYDAATQLAEIDPLAISDKAVTRAESMLHHESVEGGEWPVILGPYAVHSLILDPLTEAIDAEQVQFARSFLKDSLGTQIGSSLFNVVDDPHQPRLTGSEYYDDEGVATKRLDLVQEGMLQSLLHNSYTANKVGADFTGHASRAGVSSMPAIAPHNQIFTPGDASMEELLEGIQYGIYLDYTGDSPNLATGDFSGLVLNGQLIQDGEFGHALKNTLVAINLQDLFARIEMVGKDVTTWASAVAPHVRIERARITSGE
jgi:PmbA protein